MASNFTTSIMRVLAASVLAALIYTLVMYAVTDHVGVPSDGAPDQMDNNSSRFSLQYSGELGCDYIRVYHDDTAGMTMYITSNMSTGAESTALIPDYMMGKTVCPVNSTDPDTQTKTIELTKI